MYADDTQLYYSFLLSDMVAANTVINNDLSALAESSALHSLSLNPKKTVMIVFGRKDDSQVVKDNLIVHINGTVVLCQNGAKKLGLYREN